MSFREHSSYKEEFVFVFEGYFSKKNMTLGPN